MESGKRKSRLLSEDKGVIMRYISLIYGLNRKVSRLELTLPERSTWQIPRTSRLGVGFVGALWLMLGLWVLPTVYAETQDGRSVERTAPSLSFNQPELPMIELPEIPVIESTEPSASPRTAVPTDVTLTKESVSDHTKPQMLAEVPSPIATEISTESSFKQLSMWTMIASETPPTEAKSPETLSEKAVSKSEPAEIATVDESVKVPVNSATVAANATHYWVLSTRSTHPQWFYRDTRGRFKQADCGQFLDSTDETTPIVIFVHGNQASFARSVQMGDMLYEYLQQQNPEVRFLLWSWDSERECPFIRIDTSIKSARADAQAIPLAAFLSEIPTKTPVILVGYSFGCRIVGGAMQLYGGGQWKGESSATVAAASEMSDKVNAAPPIGTKCTIHAAILVAAAMDQNSFRPTGAMNTALKQVELSIVTTHAWDNALTLYHLISDEAAPAMGLMGPDAVAATDAEHIRTCDLSNEILPIHAWENYFSSCTLRCLLAKAVRGDAMVSPVDTADTPSASPASPDVAAHAMTRQTELPQLQ